MADESARNQSDADFHATTVLSLSKVLAEIATLVGLSPDIDEAYPIVDRVRQLVVKRDAALAEIKQLQNSRDGVTWCIARDTPSPRCVERTLADAARAERDLLAAERDRWVEQNSRLADQRDEARQVVKQVNDNCADFAEALGLPRDSHGLQIIAAARELQAERDEAHRQVEQLRALREHLLDSGRRLRLAWRSARQRALRLRSERDKARDLFLDTHKTASEGLDRVLALEDGLRTRTVERNQLLDKLDEIRDALGAGPDETAIRAISRLEAERDGATRNAEIFERLYKADAKRYQRRILEFGRRWQARLSVERESRFRWAEEAAHITAAAKALLDLEAAGVPTGNVLWSGWPHEYNDLAVAIGWRGAKRSEEYTLDDLTMTPEDHAKRAAEVFLGVEHKTARAAVDALIARCADAEERLDRAVVLPEDWHQQVMAKFGHGPRRDGSPSPRSSEVIELVESWCPATVEAALPTLAETRTGTDWCPNCREEAGTNRYDSGETSRCGTCGTELVGHDEANWCKPSVPEHVWKAAYDVIRAMRPDAHHAALIWHAMYAALHAAGYDVQEDLASNTGTEFAPLADLPEAEWQRFHHAALSARGETGTEAHDGQ